MGLKVGIAGLRRGESYVKCFNKDHRDAKVTAFCDSDEEETKYGIFS